MFGVATPGLKRDNSYDDKSNYAIASKNQRYIGGKVDYTGSTVIFKQGDVIAHVLNCDAGTLSITNETNGMNYSFNNIPKNTPLAPHFNLCYSGDKITIVQ